MIYDRKLILSDDGSHTIELVGVNEQYHSTHGAIQESEHVYIKNGLQSVLADRNEIHILEVGMGTGLNVLLTYKFAIENNIKIFYHAIEAYPVSSQLWNELNYVLQIGDESLVRVFNDIHTTNWGEEIKLNDDFVLLKKEERIQESVFGENRFELVYFDAFNPDLEPDLWTAEVFRNIYKSMRSNSVLSTYSTKGIVKRALKSCGFLIEKKPGPPGKREILNAVKKAT